MGLCQAVSAPISIAKSPESLSHCLFGTSRQMKRNALGLRQQLVWSWGNREGSRHLYTEISSLAGQSILPSSVLQDVCSPWSQAGKAPQELVQAFAVKDASTHAIIKHSPRVRQIKAI